MMEPLTREQINELGHPSSWTPDDHLAIRDTALAHLDRAENAERALEHHGYRKSCDIPACNCGDQWNHGGYAATRLSEIAEVLGMRMQGETVKGAVDNLIYDQEQAEQRAVRAEARCGELVAALRTCDNALHEIRGWYLEDMPAPGWEEYRERDRKRMEAAMLVARAALSSDGSAAEEVLEITNEWRSLRMEYEALSASVQQRFADRGRPPGFSAWNEDEQKRHNWLLGEMLVKLNKLEPAIDRWRAAREAK